MDRKRYELECLIRRPKYRSDREQFYRELPRLQDPSQWDKDDQGRSGFIPTDDERRVWKAFDKQYPERGMDHTSFVVEPYPLTYDPAWKVAVDRAVDNFYRRHHRMPQGLVTRAAIDDSTPRPECEEIYAEARRLFNAMSEWQRGVYRSSGDVIFRDSRVLIPISAETTLEQVTRIWAIVERAKSACYGSLRRRRVPRKSVYAHRIAAWVLVRERGWTTKRAAKETRLHLRTFLRRYREAAKDIEGQADALSERTFPDHVRTCARCQRAEQRGRSDLYCRFVQRALGPRTSRQRGISVSIDRADSAKSKTWRP